jgi:hypothetical protein
MSLGYTLEKYARAVQKAMAGGHVAVVTMRASSVPGLMQTLTEHIPAGTNITIHHTERRINFPGGGRISFHVVERGSDTEKMRGLSLQAIIYPPAPLTPPFQIQRTLAPLVRP